MDNNNNQKPQPNQFSIELTPQTKVSYSNLAIISHSRSEFVLDFANSLPGMPKPQVGDRIVMTPEHAKRLMNALFDKIHISCSSCIGRRILYHWEEEPQGKPLLTY